MTRLLWSAMVLAVLLLVPQARAEEKPQAKPADVDKRLAELEKQLEALTKEVRELRQELKRTNPTDQYVITLKHLDAVRAAEILQAIYRDSKAQIRITVEPVTNKLLIGADEATIAEIRQVLQVLDKPKEPEKVKQVLFPLRTIDAVETAAALKEMLGQRPGVRLAVDERTNTIIILAPEKETAQIRRLLETLDGR
jgi:type II secretory pathway component GspD/PulD (secretin)